MFHLRRQRDYLVRIRIQEEIKMGLLDDIKSDVKKSGTNKGKFLYFKSGTKVRVRFLDDMEDGHKVKFHDSYTAGINVPCQEIFDRECKYCDDDDLRTRDQYAWSVWDYDAKEVKILMAPVNQCSPVPALVSMYEAYGTLTDRDYVITKSGQQQSTTFSVVPMDKAKFRNEKAKSFSDSAFLKILDKAFPCDDSDVDEDDEELTRADKAKKAADKRKSKVASESDDWDDEEEAPDYSEMSAKELFQLCKERDIEVQPKKPAQYYITKLEDDDSKKADGWDEDEGDEDDEWEDE